MSESLTVTQAVSLLSGAPEAAVESHSPSEDVAIAPSEGEHEPDQQDFAEADLPAAEDDADGAIEPTEGEDGGEVEPAEPAIEPPKFWDAEDKAAFALLSREDQERVVKYARKGDAATSKAIEDASISRKAAEAAHGQAQAKLQELNAHVEQSAALFVRKWDNIDWPAWFQTNPQLAAQAHAEFQQEQGVMRGLLDAKTKADQDAEQRFLRTEAQALTDLAKSDPVVADLMDAKEGQARRTEVAQYLVKHGVPQDRLKLISATEMSLARKAMLYDKAQEVLKSKSSTAPTQAKAPPMSAGARGPTSSAMGVAAASEKLGKSGKLADAVALLNAQDRNRKRK